MLSTNDTRNATSTRAATARSVSTVRMRTTVIAVGALVAVLVAHGQGRKFYDDDPLWYEPETRDASGVEDRDVDLLFDLAYNLFGRPGVSLTPPRAQNVNTVDEVPDSSWFTNRILAHPLSLEALIQRPNSLEVGPTEIDAPGEIIRPKSVGAAPGFVGQDRDGETWFVTFDPRGYPETATGALMVASKLFWALGYWQSEQYLTTLNTDALRVSPEARVRMPSGQRRSMRVSDADEVLERSAPYPDGTYRVAIARRIPGRIVSGFHYHGTRSDDPNDIVAHEHRRELRALKVFGAWTNLVDMKAGNTLDTVITENGETRVRHYLQDVGSTFGSGALGPHEWDEGHEYLFETTPFWKRLVTFGFWQQPWQTVPYEPRPAVGRFEGEQFDPEAWRPRTPNGAFLNARPDDTFWAARRVMAFTDEMLRAVVKVARFSDPADEQHLADVLIARRDKIGSTYLPKINPLVDFALEPQGSLAFNNASVDAGVATTPSGYQALWAEFDNDTGESRVIGSQTESTTTRLEAPPGLPSETGAFIHVQVSATEPPEPSWTEPVHVYFRRVDDAWKLVGLDRLPDFCLSA